MKRILVTAVVALVAFLAGAAAMAPVAVTAAPAGLPGRLAACFGSHGVEFGSLHAYLCEAKLGDDPSGGLYFSPSVDDGLNKANPPGLMIWDKLHAAAGDFYIWGNYSQPWGGSTPRANGRIVAIDEGPAGQCIVVFPSWARMPTECFLVRDGGAVTAPPHPLTAIERSSVAEYIKNKRPAIPLEYR